MPSTADTPSDYFFALSNGHVPWVNSHREVSARDCIDAVERAIATGRYHNRGVEELVGGLKGLSYAETALPASTHLASLTLLKDDPRLRNRLVSSGPPSPEFCSEGSDTCTSSALSLREALATAAAAVAAQERKPPSTLPQAPDPLIFATIRQVLSSNPSYAEDVIFAVGQLPQDKRSLLFLADTECVGRSASGQPKSSAGSSKKRQRCSGGPSNESDNIGKPPAGRSRGSEKGKDGGCGENAGGGGSGRSGGGGTPPAKKDEAG
ncbi:hypothetical protein ACCO45_012874 [Purpureocillium lilacinum]|uniref:Uncharacterized protein n=1 Tax=Purpureocillium lilacinum TaxID=33203 RepID=A0ACC4DBT4_PURLI